MPETARVEFRGNNLDNVRRRNLSLILGRVHATGAMSRAELTKESGLNRSTIAALVSELVQLGLVRETDPTQTNLVGRPSPVIVPGDRTLVITVHPELDAVVVGLVALGGRVLRETRFDTATVPTTREVVSLASEAIDKLRPALAQEQRIVAIGLAIPGLVRADTGVVTLAPHLEWRDEAIGDMLQVATGIPVVAANDASLGAIAESVRGAGRGIDNLVYLNGGASGIGGGIIAAGTLLGGTSGFAGEIGHTLVNSAGVLCHCGSTGCLETEVQRADLVAALGIDPRDVDLIEKKLTAALGEPGHPVVRVVERQVGYLAIALANITNTFNPRLIVLGGFLGSLFAAAGDELVARTRARALVGARDEVAITRATLGSRILTIGAAELAFRALIADPAGSQQ